MMPASPLAIPVSVRPTRLLVSNALGLPNHENAEHNVHFDLVELNTKATYHLGQAHQSEIENN